MTEWSETDEATAPGYDSRRAGPWWMEADLMPDIVYPFILWPTGIALGGWLFFEIARRM